MGARHSAVTRGSQAPRLGLGSSPTASPFIDRERERAVYGLVPFILMTIFTEGYMYVSLVPRPHLPEGRGVSVNLDCGSGLNCGLRFGLMAIFDFGRS